MAITRRQFVTRLGAIAGAMGLGQAELSKLTEAFAHGGTVWDGGWTDKPKVVWVHGAECTGCSTSILGLFEDATGEPFPDANLNGTPLRTVDALNLAVGGTVTGAERVLTAYTEDHPFGHRTLNLSSADVGCDFDGQDGPNATDYAINIADVLIDFLDVQYHETVMSMGGDTAYQWMADAMSAVSDPFVLVVEGAVQDIENQGYWNDSTSTTPWCSIAATWNGSSTDELSFDEVVDKLANQANCKAVIAVGQCATFGGYPAAVSPVLGESQTGAQGVYDFLTDHANATEGNPQGYAKVINVPGCPVNPWWFVLTVVLWLVEATNGPLATIPADGPLGIIGSDFSIIGGVDGDRRLDAVYGYTLHGSNCPRFRSYANNTFATHPGDDGCLMMLGCKGPATNSMCGVRGWNGIQPGNTGTGLGWDYGQAEFCLTKGPLATEKEIGSCCMSAGAPCKGCAEIGYPDSFVPFVNREDTVH